jgi:zinc transporter ZupT
MATEAFSALDILRVIAITAFAGGTSFLGVYIGKRMRFTEQHVLILTAFGAGILIAAAVFEMVIEAEKNIGITLTLIAFLVGAVLFTIADMIAEKKGGGAGILLGIGLDIIPESLAIGAAIASGPALALALLIGIQNIPEGIASYKEMMTGKTAFSNNPKKALAAVGGGFCNTCIFGIGGSILFNRYEGYYSDNICTISGRYFLYVIL